MHSALRKHFNQLNNGQFEILRCIPSQLEKNSRSFECDKKRKVFSGESTTVSYLAISSWNSLSKASFGSSLIFGLFLMFFALFAYLCQRKYYFQTGFQMHFSTEVEHANKPMRRAAVERPFFSIHCCRKQEHFYNAVTVGIASFRPLCAFNQSERCLLPCSERLLVELQGFASHRSSFHPGTN